MKLIVGLGNPGDEYKDTRHNAGYMLVDKYVKECCADLSFSNEKKFGGDLLRNGEIMVFKPTLFMNKSGESVSKLVQFYNITTDDLLVIHDDLDLPIGEWKMQMGVGPKVHNGINSVVRELGSKEFMRVRIGIEAREGDKKSIPGEKYVLSRFSDEEKTKLNIEFENIISAVKEWSAKD